MLLRRNGIFINDRSNKGRVNVNQNIVEDARKRIKARKNSYCYYPVNLINKGNEQIFLYADKRFVSINSEDIPDFMNELVRCEAERNENLFYYTFVSEKGNEIDFWLNTLNDFIIFFGEEKKEIIEDFINGKNLEEKNGTLVKSIVR